MEVASQVTTWRRSLRGILACASLLAMVPAASAGQESSVPLNEEAALLGLYFSDDQLVEAATRHPKPISQVAENVTVIIAAEIKAMHAHTLAEVLERVPGIFMQFYGRGELGSRSSISIHGSDYEHVLVLIDGIRWNYVSSDLAESNAIPINIIDRIEVIKGAASSAWGSALGGVINIITKSPGRGPQPHSEIELALGEHGTRHYHAEAAGALDNLGYYLFAGRRESDGILNQRFFDDRNLFGKVSYNLPGRTRFGAQVGYSQPENRYTQVFDADADLTGVADERFLYYAAELDSAFTPSLYFYLQLHGRDNRFTDKVTIISTGAPASRMTNDEKQQGVNSRLAWERGRHTLVAGAEYLRREVICRDALAGITAAPEREEIWSLFLNDTIRLARLTITPGLRYDHLTLADDRLSPSLGATFRWTDRTLLRGAVSRGFRKPTLALKKGDPSIHPVNPELESETILTYQAGLETTAVPYLWLKATGFHHDAKHVWVFEDNPVCVDRADEPGCWVNKGQVQRSGFELTARTLPVYNISLGADYTFVRLNPDHAANDSQHQLNLLLEYNDRKGLQAQLLGHYVQWSYIFADPAFLGDYDDVIWDLIVSKTFFPRQRLEADLFFKVRNLFNGSQFHDEWLPNAPRWLEGGLRLRF
jgi:vitamin B12 transporter